MNQPAELRCTLQGTVAELPAFFERLGDWGAALDVSPLLVSSFELMLDELLTNIAMHGYHGAGGPVDVRIWFTAPDMLGATLRDQAPAFDPTALAAPDVAAALEDRQIGGLGVHFVRKLAQRFAYRRDGNVNEITLTRALAGAPIGDER